MKKVSVLIPLYNSEKYICQTLDSVLEQSWPNLEVIVVDDGSSDQGLNLAKAYQDNRVKVYSQNNAGAAAARNLAFEYSTGDFIQYLDADDLLEKDKIKHQMELLALFEEASISSSSWARFTSDTLPVLFEQQYINKDLSPVDWLVNAWQRGEMMQTACWLTPRSLIEASSGWNTKLSIADDGEFFARIVLASNKVIFSERSKVFYRSEIEGSLSKRFSHEDIKNYLWQLKLYQRHILAHEDSERVRKALLVNYQDFIYRFYGTHHDLAKECIEHVKVLGFTKLKPFGGKNARRLSKIVGFENMLRLRRICSPKYY